MSVSLVWQVLYWGWVASEIIIAVATRTGRGGGNVQDRGSQAALWIAIVAAFTACEWLRAIYPQNMFGGASWVKPAAIIVLVVALIIRWTAIVTLGREFSAHVAITESQKICRAGLYRVVRHPSYLGLWLVFVATGLHARNWPGFLVAIVPTTAALIYRIHVEEAALRKAFGEEYMAYSRETNRLIPGVY